MPTIKELKDQLASVNDALALVRQTLMDAGYKPTTFIDDHVKMPIIRATQAEQRLKERDARIKELEDALTRLENPWRDIGEAPESVTIFAANFKEDQFGFSKLVPQIGDNFVECYSFSGTKLGVGFRATHFQHISPPKGTP
jgi:hypothetical protein